jgi:hypothetical protein
MLSSSVSPNFIIERAVYGGFGQKRGEKDNFSG